MQVGHETNAMLEFECGFVNTFHMLLLCQAYDNIAVELATHGQALLTQ